MPGTKPKTWQEQDTTRHDTRQRQDKDETRQENTRGGRLGTSGTRQSYSKGACCLPSCQWICVCLFACPSYHCFLFFWTRSFLRLTSLKKDGSGGGDLSCERFWKINQTRQDQQERESRGRKPSSTHTHTQVQDKNKTSTRHESAKTAQASQLTTREHMTKHKETTAIQDSRQDNSRQDTTTHQVAEQGTPKGITEQGRQELLDWKTR